MDSTSQQRRSISTCIQILNTILGGGAGIVPLPHAIRLSGLRFGLWIILACGALSAYTACAIVSASCLVNERTYESVAKRTIGPAGAFAVRLLLIAFAFGSGVVALSIFADVAQSWLGARRLCVALAGCAVTPLVVFLRRIEALTPFSVFASALVFVFLAFAVETYASGGSYAAREVPPSSTGNSLLQATSVINLSFNTHFNLLPLFHALGGVVPLGGSISPKLMRRQQALMHSLICVASALALVIYAAIAALGCVTFGGKPSGNTLADYSGVGAFGHWINNALAIAQLVTLPLLVHEGVREAISLVGSSSSCGGSASGEQQALLQRHSHEGHTHQTSHHPSHDSSGVEGAAGVSRRVEQLCGTVWCALMTLVALGAADTSTALGIVSAICGAPLMSVLPLWMLLRADDGMGALARAGNTLLLAVGTAATVSCSLNALGAVG